ncbi:MAG: PASTA domain-containing protein [Ruminococcus sp.]|nr:PASTA domain-containing protein [Ruminococcus sp.]
MLKLSQPFKSVLSLVLAALCIFSVLALAGCSKEVTVPDVVGLTQEEAEATITDAGLVMKVLRERYSKTNPKGTVDKMKTEAGEVLESGSEVEVILSQGIGTMVPNVAGMPLSEGQNMVKVMGLNPIIVEEFSDDVEEGVIIGNENPNTQVERGSDCTITVSKGPES